MARLGADGWNVRVLDVIAFPDRDVETMLGDVADADVVGRACRGADAVFHLAALLPQRRAPKEQMVHVNVDGGRTVLAAAKGAGVPAVVYMSSAEVYGLPKQTPCPEDAPKLPLGEYGRNKVVAEKHARESAAGGLHVPILRPPTIVGPGMPEPLLTKLMADARRGRPLTVIGGGRNRFQMVAASDVSAACLRALDVPEASGEAFNIGSDNVPTMREMAERIVAQVGSRSRLVNVPAWLVVAVVKALGPFGKAPLEPEHLPIALNDYVFDISKARRVLGWTPEKDNVQALTEAYESS